MHKVYEELKEILCRELKEISRHGALDERSLELIDKLTHSIKSIDTILAMEEYGDGSSRGREAVHRVREYDDNNRDSMGRYSRSAANDELMDSLRDFMRDTNDPEKKQEIKRFMRKLEM